MNTIKKASEIVKSEIGYEILCQEEHCKLLVVLLHGYGSSGDDLISLVPYLKEQLPFAHWFAPNGIERMLAFGGYQWFSFGDRWVPYYGDQGVPFYEIDSKIILDMQKARPLLRSIIDQKRKSLNLSYQQVCVIGFSQGAMMTIDQVVSSSERFACAVSFSGDFISSEHLTGISHRSDTPICMIHGKEDGAPGTVPFAQLEASARKLRNLGYCVETYAIPNLGHSIDLSGLAFARDFIVKNLPNL